MKRLLITPRHQAAIERHAEATYPEECCGVLLGEALPEARRVVGILPARNARADSRQNRFSISPETVLAAHKEARSQGLEVIGYYHSHPDHPAKPSDFDREHAWPGLSYVIVAVTNGRAEATRSWRLTDDRERFAEEEVDDLNRAPDGIEWAGRELAAS